MGDKSHIEWTDATWNPVVGCTKVSEGCRNCYAERLAPKMRVDFSTVTLKPERLEQPLHWKQPRRIFVNSLSDLFHEEVSDTFLIQVFFTMAVTPRHIYQVLTKRPERMLSFLTSHKTFHRLAEAIAAFSWQLGWKVELKHQDDGLPGIVLPNLWLGVSVEDQATADERIPLLLKTPATVRFVSVEPLLGPMDVSAYLKHGLEIPVPAWSGDGIEARGPRIDWVICGGESGPRARPMHPDWARSIRDQCQAAGVPFFFKQWGEWVPRRAGNCDKEARTWGTLTRDGQFFKLTTPWNGHDDDGVNGEAVMHWVGKKAAGRLLDGREWSAFPSERRSP